MPYKPETKICPDKHVHDEFKVPNSADHLSTYLTLKSLDVKHMLKCSAESRSKSMGLVLAYRRPNPDSNFYPD